MRNSAEEKIEEVYEDSAADDIKLEVYEGGAAKKTVQNSSKLFTYHRLLAAMTIFFGLTFIGSIIFGALNGYHHFYSQAQADLVIIQNARLVLILLVPYVLEKLIGLRVNLKILLFFYLFAFVAAVVGETFKVYYIDGIFFDKILHGISGAFTLYIGFGFSQLLMKSSTSKHKFALAMVFGVFIAVGIAALWEMLEFGTDMLFGTNMQKLIPENSALFNGGDTFQDLCGTDEELVEFFRHPEGYRFALMDTMWDMVVAFFTTIAFIFVMVGIKAVKKDAFEDSVIYDGNLRLKFINEKLEKRRAKKEISAESEIGKNMKNE